jgi:hypothetical protein
LSQSDISAGVAEGVGLASRDLAADIGEAVAGAMRGSENGPGQDSGGLGDGTPYQSDGDSDSIKAQGDALHHLSQGGNDPWFVDIGRSMVDPFMPAGSDVYVASVAIPWVDGSTKQFTLRSMPESESAAFAPLDGLRILIRIFLSAACVIKFGVAVMNLFGQAT